MTARTTCRIAATAALALLLAASPAPAQPSGPEQEAEGPDAPAAPPDAAPGAANLSAAPRPALPLDVADLPLAPDVTRLPIGGWRLGGRAGRGEPDHGARLSIETIGRYLAFQTTGRVTLLAQASGPTDDPPLARRASLARAITVKASLVRGGLAGTRIDIRPLGRTPEGADAIDIIAPAAPRRREQAAPAATPPPAPTPTPPGSTPSTPASPSPRPRGG